MLEPFRGRCPFRQFIKSKPAKYGVKVYSLVDAKTFYCSNMEVYCGTQPEGPYRISNSAKDVVLRLIQPISNSGRNVTVDNYFCSLPLLNELAKDHHLSVVGTLRKNKRDTAVSPEYTTHKNRQLYRSFFVHKVQVTILSCKSKQNKVVLLLSSLNRPDEIDTKSGEAMKPQMLTYYNQIKDGVYTLDKLKATYNVARKTNRWPLSLFFALLNIATVNAYIMYFMKHMEGHFKEILSKNVV
uniref:PiggyBac transposable element-derived protein domain-containing protein n=1 Tax=Graphocephala atropunctata TaxID=36148 RepID=A0A1B6L6A3_9HEMI